MIAPQLEVTQPRDNRRFAFYYQNTDVNAVPLEWRQSVPGFIERLQNVAFITVSATYLAAAAPLTYPVYVSLGGLLDANYHQTFGFTYLALIDPNRPPLSFESNFSLANTSINVDQLDFVFRDYDGNKVTLDPGESVTIELEVSYYYIQPATYLTY